MKHDLDIVQFIYCSHATSSRNKARFERDVQDILHRSRSRNPLNDITGALLTDGTRFAQVIEGPSAAVRSLHSRIIHDWRHDRVVTLQHTLTHVRLFGLYPIAVLRVERVPYAGLLNAQSELHELRAASISVLKAFRPLLLKQAHESANLW